MTAVDPGHREWHALPGALDGPMWSVLRWAGVFVRPYRADSADEALAQTVQLGSVAQQGPRLGML
jgi:hypothetical protein